MIGVYVEITNKGVDPAVCELITAAKEVKAVAQEKLCLLVAGDNVAQYKEALALEGVDEIYAAELKGVTFAQGDALSAGLAEMLQKLDLAAVLVPATKTARAIFARVAMKLNLGMTADCTSLQTEVIDGRTVVHQIKPSFGAQVLVSCDVPKGTQIITIRPGIYEAAKAAAVEPVWTELVNKEIASQIEVLGFEASQVVDSITGADVIVAVGKGALENNNFDLAKAYAAKLGAAIAGTRPMADNGYLPFEAQIGQSGTVVRPKAVVTLGVSGAVQFTEGIQGEPLVIAVNNDPQAAIFGFAKFGAVMDMHELLEELVK